jgi:hypothetical protein
VQKLKDNLKEDKNEEKIGDLHLITKKSHKGKRHQHVPQTTPAPVEEPKEIEEVSFI